jgi:hypothetical protein
MLLPSNTQVPLLAAYWPAASILGRPLTPFKVMLLAFIVQTSPEYVPLASIWIMAPAGATANARHGVL